MPLLGEASSPKVQGTRLSLQIPVDLFYFHSKLYFKIKSCKKSIREKDMKFTVKIVE